MKRIGLRRARLLLVVWMGAALALQGCASPEPVVRLTASIYPVYCMLKQLTKGVERVSVQCLATINAGCAHDYQITSADRKLLADSALIAMNGAGMEPYLEPLVEGLQAKIVRTAAGLELLPGDGHDGEYNPHTWLNPLYAAKQSNALAEELERLLPDQAGVIERNRVEAEGRYIGLDEEMRVALGAFKGKPIVTFHSAFEYFAMGCGLSVAATLTSDPHASPSGRALSKVVDIVRDEGISTIFAERESDLTSAQTVARETGAKLGFLDTAAYPMVDVEDTEVYFKAMRSNVKALVDAFDGQ